MILHAIEAGPFATYATFDKCPPVGLTTIVGENGTGKSVGGYEILSWCLWGETVRGAKITDGRATVMVEVRGEFYTVSRSLNARSHKLSFKVGTIEATAATRTDTQKRIIDKLGTHERFCAGRVFARDLLARFGLATDAQRKELLEEVLGLQQFDRAQVQGRTELAQADVKRSIADHEYVTAKRLDNEATMRVKALHERRVRAIGEVKAELSHLQIEHDDVANVWQTIGRRLEQLQEELSAVTISRMKADRLYEANEQNIKAIKHAIQSIEEGCMCCGRPFDEKTKQEELAKQQANLAGGMGFDHLGLARLRVAEGLLSEEFGELMEANKEHLQRQAARRERLAELTAELETATTAAEDYADAVGEQTETERVMWEKFTLREQVAHDYAVLKACDGALGIKGARVLLLSRALERLNREANHVLAMLHPTLRIGIQINAKDGVDVIVKGAGGGEYRGCSGGQRVLIDVAFMLGLAAMNGGDGFLVFDEVFDSLDKRAVEAVAEYVQALARTRQIVVISHREDLTSMFRKTASWRARFDGDFSVMETA